MTRLELDAREKELQEKLQLLVRQAQSLQQAILVTRGRLEEIQDLKKKKEGDGSQ
jgi:hypothetical protein